MRLASKYHFPDVAELNNQHLKYIQLQLFSYRSMEQVTTLYDNSTNQQYRYQYGEENDMEQAGNVLGKWQVKALTIARSQQTQVKQKKK